MIEVERGFEDIYINLHHDAFHGTSMGVKRSELNKLIEDLKKVREEIKAEDARKTIENSHATPDKEKVIEQLRSDVEALKRDVLWLKKEPLTIDILKTLKEGTLVIGSSEDTPDRFIEYDDYNKSFLVREPNGSEFWIENRHLHKWRLA